MVYRIVLKDENGKQYFHTETYHTPAEVATAFEIMEEDGENVQRIVADYE